MRICVHQFSIANEAYIGASVSFYTVDGNGSKTSILATLYDSTTGTGTLSNPQTLDSEGKLSQPSYIDEPVIAAVSGLGFSDHDTGIINLILNPRGDWATTTVYAVNDLVTDAATTGNIYICTARHTAGTFATDRDTNLYWDLFINLETVKDWTQKTSGAVDGSEYSAKAYAVGGTGITNTASKGAAKEWATKLEDSTVDGSEYSAKHYSAKASGSATGAAASAAVALAATVGKYDVRISITSVDSPYTVVAMTQDTLLNVDTTGGAVVVNLPAASGETDNRLLGINKIGAANTVTITANGADTVGGAASFIQYDDTEWADLYLDKTATDWLLGNLSYTSAGTGLEKLGSTIGIAALGVGLVQLAVAAKTESHTIAVSDETTSLTVGTAKITFRMPYALTLTAVRASMTTAPTGSALTADINEGGVSILSTKLTIDAGEKTSTTAATPAVISDTALADDAEMTIDIDGIGSTIAGAGLKITLIGYKP